MNKILTTLLLLFTSVLAHSQIHEFGVGIGGANYVGDVGSTQFIEPKDIGYNLFYRWNRSPRHSYRLSYSNHNISGDDLKSSSLSRQERGFSFENKIQQLSLGVEFNFFEFDLHEENFGFTPYLFVGLSAIRYDDIYFRRSSSIIGFDSDRVELVKGKRENSLAIPFAGGLKLRLTSKINLNAEVAAHYTMAKNLDGSSPKGANRQAYSFGKNGNDWFFYSSISISYTFGNNPCYCAD